jgi:hypothetical protein
MRGNSAVEEILSGPEDRGVGSSTGRCMSSDGIERITITSKPINNERIVRVHRKTKIIHSKY